MSRLKLFAHREVELPVGGKHRGISAAGGRKFFGYRQLPPFPTDRCTKSDRS